MYKTLAATLDKNGCTSREDTVNGEGDWKAQQYSTTVGTNSEDIAVPETIPLQDSSQFSSQEMSTWTSVKLQLPKSYF
jgi:hypothetical protein